MLVVGANAKTGRCCSTFALTGLVTDAPVRRQTDVQSGPASLVADQPIRRCSRIGTERRSPRTSLRKSHMPQVSLCRADRRAGPRFSAVTNRSSRSLCPSERATFCHA